MPEISRDYASPGLRWGLLLEDHPGATYKFEAIKGTELGIPADFGGNGNFVRATIEIPGHAPVFGFKPLAEATKTPDGYNLACTKALGRALKRAGYPDSTVDLRHLVLWRQRKVELARLEAGQVIQAIDNAANDVKELEASLPARQHIPDDQFDDEPAEVEMAREDEAIEATAGDDGEDAPDDQPEEPAAPAPSINSLVDAETAAHLLHRITDAHSGLGYLEEQGVELVRLVTAGRHSNLKGLTEVDAAHLTTVINLLDKRQLDLYLPDPDEDTPVHFVDHKGRAVDVTFSPQGAVNIALQGGAEVEDIDWRAAVKGTNVTQAALLRQARIIAAELDAEQPRKLDDIEGEVARRLIGWIEQMRAAA